MLTRREAAKILKCSTKTVQRLEKTALTPIKFNKTLSLYDEAEVARVALEREQIEKQLTLEK